MALAAAGLLSPTLAAFIHVTSELTFILNSARLLPRIQAGAALAEMRVPSEHDSLAKAA
jgi:Cd2+/Zn2+-exporting ATPase/Cu+-exporting ATPase